MKQEIIEKIMDPARLRKRVETGITLLTKEFGPGWPARFANTPLNGVGYTDQCQFCVADIASGLPGTDGWCQLEDKYHDDTLALAGLNLEHEYANRLGWVAEDAALTKLWREEIDKLLAAGVQV